MPRQSFGRSETAIFATCIYWTAMLVGCTDQQNVTWRPGSTASTLPEALRAFNRAHHERLEAIGQPALSIGELLVSLSTWRRTMVAETSSDVGKKLDPLLERKAWPDTSRIDLIYDQQRRGWWIRFAIRGDDRLVHERLIRFMPGPRLMGGNRSK